MFDLIGRAHEQDDDGMRPIRRTSLRYKRRDEVAAAAGKEYL